LSPIRDFGGALIQLSRNIMRKPDFYAGELIVLFGLVTALLKGPEYRLGTLMHMEAGLVSTVLGVLLILLGALIAGTATGLSVGQREHIATEHSHRSGWACILAGQLLFIICGSFGFVPASLSFAFVSTLGDRTTSWKSALVLAIIKAGARC
jgi:hypothetical protein